MVSPSVGAAVTFGNRQSSGYGGGEMKTNSSSSSADKKDTNLLMSNRGPNNNNNNNNNMDNICDGISSSNGSLDSSLSCSSERKNESPVCVSSSTPASSENVVEDVFCNINPSLHNGRGEAVARTPQLRRGSIRFITTSHRNFDHTWRVRSCNATSPSSSSNASLACSPFRRDAARASEQHLSPIGATMSTRDFSHRSTSNRSTGQEGGCADDRQSQRAVEAKPQQQRDRKEKADDGVEGREGQETDAVTSRASLLAENWKIPTSKRSHAKGGGAPQSLLWITSYSEYGTVAPRPNHFPGAYFPKDLQFSSSFPAGGSHKNASLNTSITRSKVHSTFDRVY